MHYYNWQLKDLSVQINFRLIEKMIGGDLRNLINLDESNSINRQKQLYATDLQFDPERPIYQHPLNLNNYIDPNNQAIFQQLVKNILLSHPSPQNRTLCEDYESIQRELDNIGHGYMNELQDEQNKQIRQLKSQIQEKQQKIENLTQENNKRSQQNQSLRIQINQYQKFIVLKQSKLQNINNAQKFYQEINTQFDETKKELQQKSSSFLDKFQTQYNTIVYEKEALSKTINLQNQLKSKKYGLQNEMSTVRKLSLKIQDEIDNLKEEIAMQTTTRIQVSQKLSASHLSKQTAQHTSPHRLYTKEAQTKVKQYYQIIKEQPNQYCLIILIALTILLTILTLHKII